MRVKIGNTWYDSHNEPICVQVSEQEQEHIATLDRKTAPEGKYASFPQDLGINVSEMLAWMKDPE